MSDAAGDIGIRRHVRFLHRPIEGSSRRPKRLTGRPKRLPGSSEDLHGRRNVHRTCPSAPRCGGERSGDRRALRADRRDSPSSRSSRDHRRQLRTAGRALRSSGTLRTFRNSLRAAGSCLRAVRNALRNSRDFFGSPVDRPCFAGGDLRSLRSSSGREAFERLHNAAETAAVPDEHTRGGNTS